MGIQRGHHEAEEQRCLHSAGVEQPELVRDREKREGTDPSARGNSDFAQHGPCQGEAACAGEQVEQTRAGNDIVREDLEPSGQQQREQGRRRLRESAVPA